MSGERATPKQERAELMRARLVSTASDLFVEHGLEAVSVNSIAQAAEVSIGSFYRYFADKDALLEELTRIHLDGLDELFADTVLHEPDLLLADLLDRILDPIVAYWEQHPIVAVLLGRSPGGLPARDRQSLFARLVERVEVLLDEWVDHLPHDERRTTAQTIVAVSRALLFEVEVDDDRQRRALRDELKYLIRAYAVTKYPGPDDPVWEHGGNPPPARPGLR